MDVVAGGGGVGGTPPLSSGRIVRQYYRLRLVPGAVEVAWCRATAGSDRIASLLSVSSCRPSGGGVRRPWAMAGQWSWSMAINVGGCGGYLGD